MLLVIQWELTLLDLPLHYVTTLWFIGAVWNSRFLEEPRNIVSLEMIFSSVIQVLPDITGRR